MTLDACVYCDCFEKGKLITPPAPVWHVYVDKLGFRTTSVQDEDESNAFDRWNRHACEHEDGILVHHFLGNIARVEKIRNTLLKQPECFSIILSRIVHNGVHCGDFLTLLQVHALIPELQCIHEMKLDATEDSDRLRYFEQQMCQLVDAALKVQKPITF